jgi:hypothetical protein
MEIVIATRELAGPGGVQSYVLTVAPHLERLGHGVTLHAPVLGEMADLAREHGLRVAAGERALPERCDVVLAQDAPSALDMAARFPEATGALVVHGAEYDVHLPPPADGVVDVAIAMNGAVARRLGALARPVEVVRLRQPVDVNHFAAVGPVRERPESALLLGNYLGDRRRAALAGVLEAAGVAVREVGVLAGTLADPLPAILEADVVVGQGRSVLEAMACGRAALVYGPMVGDGWVTESAYPAMEEDGFRGRGNGDMYDAAAVARVLGAYSPSMGELNRALVVTHHSAYDHAVALVAAIDRPAAAAPVDGAPLRELAQLIRTLHEKQAQMTVKDRALRELVDQRDAIARDNEALRVEQREMYERIADLEARLARGAFGRRRRQA